MSEEQRLAMIRKKGIEALREKLKPDEVLEFLQMLGKGEGDYTEDRKKNIDEYTIEDFEKFLNNNKNC